MTTRYLLFGASNLAVSFPRLYASLGAASKGAVEVWGAFGHGRSYGIGTRVLGRGLPGIAECGLWRALEERPAATAHALVADVGNDLLFGPSVETIAGWVDRCLARVSPLGGRVALMGLPLGALERLPGWRFVASRTLLYPSCRKPWRQIRDEARALDAALRDLARRHGAFFLEPRPEWYGLDPVHVRPRALETAWNEILEGWLGMYLAPLGNHLAPRPAPRPAWRRRLRLWTLAPEERVLWGRPRRTPQPVLEEDEGGAVYLY